MSYSMKQGRLICPAYENLGIPALYVHDLTGTADADQLLSKPPLIHPAALDLLPRLRQWNPEIASKFSEKDNAVKKIPFKLITKDRIWISDQANSFVAVSYCWHSDQWIVPNRFNSMPENWSLPVSPAMLRALLCYVENGEAIWMDQLCIDQNNLKQKAHAIANMDTIYRNAQQVVVLLEDLDISPDVEQSLSLLAATPTGKGNIRNDRLCVSRDKVEQNFSTCFAQGSTMNLFSFAYDVFDCRWFTRAWCCQEYQLNANRSFVFVGHTYSCVALASKFFMDFHSESDDAGLGSHDLYTLPAFQMFSFGIGVNEPHEMSEFDLFHLFVELERMSCLYLRDIVSVALNASGLFLSFNSDINSTTECRFILALVLLSAGDPGVLDTVGPPVCKWSAPSHQAIIRWPVNDDFRYWSVPHHAKPRLGSHLKFGHISLRVITLDLFSLHSPPRFPNEAFRKQARACWTAFENAKERSRMQRDSCEVEIAALACALSIGLPWMVQTINDGDWFLRDFQTGQSLTEAAYKSLVVAVNSLLSTEDGAAKQSFQVERSVMQLILPFLNELPIHFRHVSRTIPLEMRLNREGTQNAILFVPSRLKQYVESSTFTFHIAVPAALNTTEAAHVRRVWILEDAKTFQPALSIVGQGYSLGVDLTVDDEVSYTENMAVVGRWNDESDGYDSAEDWADDPMEAVYELGESEWSDHTDIT